MDEDAGDPDARERAEIVSTQAMAAGEDRLAAAHVVADADDVLPGRDAPVHLDLRIPDLLGVLDHHHAVRAGWQHAAGGDAHRLALPQLTPGRLPHGDRTGEAQIGRQGLRRAEGVGRADRVPVHVRAVEVRQVSRGDHVVGEDPIRGIGDLHPLSSDRREAGERRPCGLGRDRLEEELQTASRACGRHGSSRRTRAR